jgi:hypothetical protein
MEASIEKNMKLYGLTRDQVTNSIEEQIEEGIVKREGDLLRMECHGRDLLPLPLICCFSEKCDNILMWSHYANYHKGVCLRFKSKLIEGFPYLTINSKAVELFPMNYDIIPPYPINYHNQVEGNAQLLKLLSTKSLDWEYENEYIMFLTEEDSKENLNDFKKEELEGIILGMRIDYIDANEIYETINKNEHEILRITGTNR